MTGLDLAYRAHQLTAARRLREIFTNAKIGYAYIGSFAAFILQNLLSNVSSMEVLIEFPEGSSFDQYGIAHAIEVTDKRFMTRNRGPGGSVTMHFSMDNNVYEIQIYVVGSLNFPNTLLGKIMEHNVSFPVVHPKFLSMMTMRACMEYITYHRGLSSGYQNILNDLWFLLNWMIPRKENIDIQGYGISSSRRLSLTYREIGGFLIHLEHFYDFTITGLHILLLQLMLQVLTAEDCGMIYRFSGPDVQNRLSELPPPPKFRPLGTVPGA